MSAKKSTSRLNQKLIVVLLSLKILLAGIEATERIQQGDSVTETLIWLINQCIPVLQLTSRREEEEKKGDGLRPGGSDRNSTKK
ncbi:hypothetical protein [Cylindrospermum sp. FACHB-282]|uniref:hypothetical protein n=1 Tax=Cylindrospermum sp. FACHB-282 TaxID=2692794 RepID=UPI0016879726|nr:hypothetical protein [Cylindrospermum sp. FACHB-282]MBD2385373.1 hypothetical protein [Cylindrospermum sp. FACHB-282]